MTLAIFLIKSSMTLIILLVLYRVLFEKEKMHNFNRGYLLVTLIFSFVLPFLPTGIPFLFESSPIISELNDPIIYQVNEVALQEYALKSYLTLWNIIIGIYSIGFIIFAMRYISGLLALFGKINSNEVLGYKGAQLVLVPEELSPFTFLNYIFVNKQEFISGSIERQLISHELTHARERHSLDVLLIELFTTVFWFNPIFRSLKKAIQLNHEFLADESVIDKYKEVKTYQYLLLDTIQNNKKISLASNINFHLTQKRLKMMTKESSSKKKKVLIFSLLPTALVLLMALGQPISEQHSNPESVLLEQVDPNKAKDRHFKHAIIHYKTEDGKIKVISYKSMSAEMKAKLPLPPPPPPAPPGTENSNMKLEPLPKGTIVYLSENGNVNIQSTGNERAHNVTPPPPPPTKKMKTKKGQSIGAPPAPPAPSKVVKGMSKEEGLMPPPPPPPLSIDELIEMGSTFYINGKEVTSKEVKRQWDKKGDKVATVDVKMQRNGTSAIYLVIK